MFKKLFLAVVLSLSIPCFAESGGNKSKALIDNNQKTQSSIDTGQQTQSSQSGSPAKKEDSQSTQDSNVEKKPSMIKYCREHTC